MKKYWLVSVLPLLAALAGSAGAQTFTLQVGAAPLPPTPLVNHGDTWRYRPARTNAPQADWRSAASAGLDGTWLSGPGGFGFGDAAILGEATTLSTMLNNYSSLAIRREFNIGSPVDAARRIQLTVDYDDGYVAWLDGTEIARSPNASGLGNPPAYNASTVSANHEASCCDGTTNPPTVIDLGVVGARLAPGPHVFALQGINSGSNSSDFHLIADLTLIGGTGTAQDGAFFSLVNTNTTGLSGTNTLPGSTRVVVNGVGAAFDPVTGVWSKSQLLQPGMNRLFIAALDAGGNILYATNRDVVCELATVAVGGDYGAGSFPSVPGTTIRVTNDLIINTYFLFQATNSTVILLSPGVSIRTPTNVVFEVLGNPGAEVFFLPANGSTPWGGLRATGTNALVNLDHVETVAGQVRAQNGGVVLVDNSVLRDLNVASRVLVEGLNGGGITVRRSHLARYVECDSSETPTLYEDCLLEHITTDGLDLKGTNVSIVVRRCTLRFGPGSNTDAVDYGPGPGSLVEDCLIHDFGDKGVSVAANTAGTVVRNSVIYGNTFGISCDSTTNIIVVGNTIVGCQVALNQEAGASAHVSEFGTNNILWGNATNAVVPTNGALLLEYSDTEGGVFPGPGNISADPRFQNATAHDFRLQFGSPAIGSGLDGASMGVAYPVGGIPSAPFNLAAHAAGLGPVQIWWRDSADNEYGTEVYRSTDGVNWLGLVTVPADATNYTDNTAAVDQTYFYRVRASNFMGDSAWSNLASARRGVVINVICGTLAANANWSPAQGEYLVCSNTVVPANVTLTIEAGTVVRLTNAASLRAVGGGAINIAGTEDNKVVLMGVDGANIWGEISAQFAGSSLTIRHADISRRQTTVYSNAVMLLEDSFFHDYRLTSGSTILTAPIILTHFAAPVEVRRCHVREYHETLWRNGIFHITGSLFEDIHGDAVDFDSAQPGSLVEWCTFRHGTNGNVDAMDLGPGDLPGSTDVRIENCVMFDFPFDKGLSVGDQGSSHGNIISNCLIYACRAGVMAKDSCDISVRQCTIADNGWAFTNYNKSGSASFNGGYTTNSYNNILWNNTITIAMRDSAVLVADHNNLGNTNWPGVGNINVNPLFVNPAQRDYRLPTNSPCLGVGRNGGDMGANFTIPLGSVMAPSHPFIERIAHQGQDAIIRFWVDSEKTYTLLAGPTVTGPWSKLGDAFPTTNPRPVSMTNAVPAGENRFYRLVSPAQP